MDGMLCGGQENTGDRGGVWGSWVERVGCASFFVLVRMRGFCRARIQDGGVSWRDWFGCVLWTEG